MTCSVNATARRSITTIPLMEVDADMRLLCPVCDQVSTAEHDDAGEGLRFRCETCGEFSISDISALAIHRFKPDMRQNFLRIAAHRAGPRGVPHISHVD